VSSIPTKTDHPIPEIRQSNFCNFEQELPIPVQFMWNQLLHTH
jgi:hypothetical protein